MHSQAHSKDIEKEVKGQEEGVLPNRSNTPNTPLEAAGRIDRGRQLLGGH